MEVTARRHIVVLEVEQFQELCYIDCAPWEPGFKRWAGLRTVLWRLYTLITRCQKVSRSTNCVTLTAHRESLVLKGEQVYEPCYEGCTSW